MIDDTFIMVTRETMPWGDEAVIAKYDDNSDPRLHGYSAMVIKDSRIVEDELDRLTTMIVRFPRCILSEMNTHRVFSRNSASSRARSVKTTIKQVVEQPYIPLFTQNAKGMQGPFIEDPVRFASARAAWLRARDNAVRNAIELLLGTQLDMDILDYESFLDQYYADVYGNEHSMAPDVHKQTVNRLLEPFMWHEMLITSSYWENFFNLRMDKAAQPEMQAIATLMYCAYISSKPVKRELHLPFIASNRVANLSQIDHIREVCLESASECARISYHDRSTMDPKHNTDLGLRLLSQGHMSPFEHQAIERKYFNRLVYRDGGHPRLCGNLAPFWCQYRKIIEEERAMEVANHVHR